MFLRAGLRLLGLAASFYLLGNQFENLVWRLVTERLPFRFDDELGHFVGARFEAVVARDQVFDDAALALVAALSARRLLA